MSRDPLEEKGYCLKPSVCSYIRSTKDLNSGRRCCILTLNWFGPGLTPNDELKDADT